MKIFACLFAIALPALAAPGIRTFTVKLRGGEKIVAGDEKTFAKFDMVMITRNWSDAIAAIRKANPATEIFIQTEGPTLWKEGDAADIARLKDVGRYDISRGHSMGAINRDHPEFFLLDNNGERCAAYAPEYKERYLMDFGSRDYQRYWVEAIAHDVLQQPWRGAGIHIDNIGPLCTFPAGKPAKYDTDEKWAAAALSYIDYVTGAMHRQGAKVWINAGGTDSDRGWKALQQLDSLANAPDVVGEEGAFAIGWGNADTRFPSEEKWKHSVYFMSRLRKSRQAYFSHTRLRRGGGGTDNYGKPVTFWQSLWYAMCSYLLGKDGDNSYFFFSSRGDGGYGANDWWFEEYERIDLGRAAGPYRKLRHGDANVYWREFERGYVFVNPTEEEDAAGVPLPGPCRQLNHENFKKDPGTLAHITRLNLTAHHGTILLKVK
jgi:hypothetical protein